MRRAPSGVDAPRRGSYHSRAMKHAILAAITSALVAAAGPAFAQSMSSTPKTPKPQVAPKKAQEKLTPTEAKAKDYDLAKVKFLSAMGACAKPEDCDPESPRRNAEVTAMVKGAEESFMLACFQCATDEDCEQERDRIRQGRARTGKNPCLVAMKKAKDDADKKKAAGAPDKKGAPASPPEKKTSSTSSGAGAK